MTYLQAEDTVSLYRKNPQWKLLRNDVEKIVSLFLNEDSALFYKTKIIFKNIEILKTKIDLKISESYYEEGRNSLEIFIKAHESYILFIQNLPKDFYHSSPEKLSLAFEIYTLIKNYFEKKEQSHHASTMNFDLLTILSLSFKKFLNSEVAYSKEDPNLNLEDAFLLETTNYLTTLLFLTDISPNELKNTFFKKNSRFKYFFHKLLNFFT